MKNEIRNGYYAKFGQELYNFHEIESNKYELVDRDNRYEILKKKGFKKYNSYVSYLELKRDEIFSACQITTYCIYNGFKFFIENFFEGKYIIRPLEEAQAHFKDFAHHGYDPVYEIEENELEEIWEERKPIDGFIFDVEPIFYIKKRAN